MNRILDDRGFEEGAKMTYFIDFIDIKVGRDLARTSGPAPCPSQLGSEFWLENFEAGCSYGFLH